MANGSKGNSPKTVKIDEGQLKEILKKIDGINKKTAGSKSDKEYGIESSLKSSWWELASKLGEKEQQAKETEAERIKDQTPEEKQREADSYQLWLEKDKLFGEIKKRANFVETQSWIDNVIEEMNNHGKNENILSKDWNKLIKEIETADFMERTTYKWDEENRVWIRGKFGLKEDEKTKQTHLETVQYILRKAFTDYVIDQIIKSGEKDREKRKKILKYKSNWQERADWEVYEKFSEDNPQFFV